MIPVAPGQLEKLDELATYCKTAVGSADQGQLWLLQRRRAFEPTERGEKSVHRYYGFIVRLVPVPSMIEETVWFAGKDHHLAAIARFLHRGLESLSRLDGHEFVGRAQKDNRRRVIVADIMVRRELFVAFADTRMAPPARSIVEYRVEQHHRVGLG